jgi:hypothetical protein
VEARKRGSADAEDAEARKRGNAETGERGCRGMRKRGNVKVRKRESVVE